MSYMSYIKYMSVCAHTHTRVCAHAYLINAFLIGHIGHRGQVVDNKRLKSVVS